jgi:hypothetical protein
MGEPAGKSISTMLVLAHTFDGTKTHAWKCRKNKRPGNGVSLPGFTEE